jgi:hypothetical protein
MKLSDPWLGERPMPTSPRGLIEDQRRVLSAMRDDGREPSKLLLEDIAAYEWLIAGSDQLITRYFNLKAMMRASNTAPESLAVSRVCRRMGWTPQTLRRNR